MINEGKTKIIESISDSTLVRVRTKDVLTANDSAKRINLPVAEDKTSQNCSVMFYLKSHNIPVAYKTRNDDTSFIAEKCSMIPIECVIRRHPYGSYLKRNTEKLSTYKFSPPLCEFFHKNAVVLPILAHKNLHAITPEVRLMLENSAREYFMENGKWTHTVYTDPLIETTTRTWFLYPAKEPKLHPLMHIDPIVNEKTLEYIKNKLMIPTFELLEKAWLRFKVKLIDLKIEVGFNYNNELIIADVIDNDSWRIWLDGDPYQQLDKQAFRDGEEIEEIQKKYSIVTNYTKKF